MIFLKIKKKTGVKNRFLINVASLLIHASKIDEKYTLKEKEIIKKTLIELGAEISDIDNLIDQASTNEENANQILDFTREIKNSPNSEKIKIIETLWKIIYSDQDASIYETNLMRRLAGLLYIDNKQMGDIKEKIKKDFIR